MPSEIASSNSFLLPGRNDLSVDFRVQLVCGLFLLRCLFDSATLAGFMQLRGPAFGSSATRLHISMETSLQLVFFMFILLEDGQGLCTFILFGLREGGADDCAGHCAFGVQQWLSSLLRSPLRESSQVEAVQVF